MKALTVRQPWATLIADRIKTVENRSWPVPRGFTGPLLIHAAALIDKQAMGRAQVTGSLGRRRVDELPASAIIAVVGGVRSHQDADPAALCDPWGLPNHWHWELADVRPLPRPVPAKGRLGLWLPDAETLAAVEAQYGEMEVAW